jgi:hypothetical protein
MKGDFSRQTFDAARHFSRVLMQQGRVQLDADWNEQAAILLHYLQSLAADLIGPHGGPEGEFLITQRINENESSVPYDFVISKGHYYVDGILCENDAEMGVPYTAQPDYPIDDLEKILKSTDYLVYLDVWERHITCIEESSVREIALGGPDTATRAKVVWQAKIEYKAPDDETFPTDCPGAKNIWNKWIENWQPANRGSIKVKGKQPPKKPTDHCLISAEAKYRGAENHLYRVEVHGSGLGSVATFKWSRDNGSVVFPIQKLEGVTVTLEHLGLEDTRNLKVGQWIEIMDDNLAKRGEAGPYLQVESIDAVEKTAILIVPPDISLPVYDINDPRHPLLRRWDSSLVDIAESTENWIDLEDGISIQFQPAESGNAHSYRCGDYWLIPARTATGDVEWPVEDDNNGHLIPVAQPPHGVEHHYAPLGIITTNGTVIDCRCSIEPAAKCPTPQKTK